MTTNYESAYQSITAELKAYWALGSDTFIGGAIPEIRWYGIEEEPIPKADFIRFQMQPVTSHQSSFRQTDGKRYAPTGNVIIQVMAYRQNRQAYARMRAMSIYLQARFRKAIDCISFTNVRIVDVEKEENFLRQNVVAVYRYDEIQ